MKLFVPTLAQVRTGWAKIPRRAGFMHRNYAEEVMILHRKHDTHRS